MSIIRNLQIDEEGWFSNGLFKSTSLFKEEMAVSIFVDDGATEDDAIKCIEHYNGLLEKPEMCRQIQEKLEKFFLYMYDEWHDFSAIYGDIVKSLEPVMDGYKEGKQLITYLYKPTLYVFPQLENEIGYGLECECPWEPEHQCLILIRNDKVVYVGPSDGKDAWGDDDDYYCVWNDEDES